VFTYETANVKGEIERKLSRKGPNFGGFRGPVGSEDRKFRFVLQKAHLYVDPRRLSHFAWKLVWGVASRSVREKIK